MTVEGRWSLVHDSPHLRIRISETGCPGTQGEECHVPPSNIYFVNEPCLNRRRWRITDEIVEGRRKVDNRTDRHVSSSPQQDVSIGNTAPVGFHCATGLMMASVRCQSELRERLVNQDLCRLFLKAFQRPWKARRGIPRKADDSPEYPDCMRA